MIMRSLVAVAIPYCSGARREQRHSQRAGRRCSSSEPDLLDSATPTASASEPASQSPTTATASYSESDKKAFLDAIYDETKDLGMDEEDADLVSLADSMIAAHGRGGSWKDVVKILKENFSESDAEIYGELVVIHLMKNLPEDDAWKVAAGAERRAREAAQAPEPEAEPVPEPTETKPAMTAS